MPRLNGGSVKDGIDNAIRDVRKNFEAVGLKEAAEFGFVWLVKNS